MVDPVERPVPWSEWKTKHPRWAQLTSPEWALSWVVFRLKGLAVFQMLELAGKVSVVVALVTWVMEADSRRQQKHYQAWTIINTARGGGGEGGRISALQDLNHDHVSLSGISVNGSMLHGIDLPDAELFRADLSHSDLSAANLRSADLREASLVGANLIGAKLRYANFGSINTHNFQDEHLRKIIESKNADPGAKLNNSKLISSDMRDSIIIGADLSNANMLFANLRGALLSNSVLRGANLQDARMSGAILFQADLTDANLFRAEVFDTPLKKAKLCRTVLPDGQRSDRDCPSNAEEPILAPPPASSAP